MALEAITSIWPHWWRSVGMNFDAMAMEIFIHGSSGLHLVIKAATSLLHKLRLITNFLGKRMCSESVACCSVNLNFKIWPKHTGIILKCDASTLDISVRAFRRQLGSQPIFQFDQLKLGNVLCSPIKNSIWAASTLDVSLTRPQKCSIENAQ
jgi:hypothetical protein